MRTHHFERHPVQGTRTQFDVGFGVLPQRSGPVPRAAGTHHEAIPPHRQVGEFHIALGVMCHTRQRAVPEKRSPARRSPIASTQSHARGAEALLRDPECVRAPILVSVRCRRGTRSWATTWLRGRP